MTENDETVKEVFKEYEIKIGLSNGVFKIFRNKTGVDEVLASISEAAAKNGELFYADGLYMAPNQIVSVEAKGIK